MFRAKKRENEKRGENSVFYGSSTTFLGDSLPAAPATGVEKTAKTTILPQKSVAF